MEDEGLESLREEPRGDGFGLPPRIHDVSPARDHDEGRTDEGVVRGIVHAGQDKGRKRSALQVRIMVLEFDIVHGRAPELWE